jgi:hypothetical protein
MVLLYFLISHWSLFFCINHAILSLVHHFCHSLTGIKVTSLVTVVWVYSPTFSHLYSLALFSQDILPLTRLCVRRQEGLIKRLLCLGETIDILVLACVSYLFLPECTNVRLVLVPYFSDLPGLPLDIVVIGSGPDT